MSQRKVLYDFAGDPADPEQVSVTVGESVTGGEDAGDGWVYILTSSGKRGLVPGSYLSEPIATEPTVAAPETAAPLPLPVPVASSIESDPSTVDHPPDNGVTSEVPTLDPALTKYEKMKRAGLPEGAIRNAMQRDGVDPSRFFGAGAGGDPTAPVGGSSGEAAALPSVSSSGFVRSDDPALDKYKKMEKTGLPEGAIRNAMARDGVDASLMFGGASEKPKTPLVIPKATNSSSPGDNLADQLKQARLSAAPKPTTPPKSAAAPPVSAKSETSPFDEVKKRALERQKRLEEGGSLLTDGPHGGASWSPPDKTQWKPNLRKAEPPIREPGQSTASHSAKPGWSGAQLKKVEGSTKRAQDVAEMSPSEVIPPTQTVYEKLPNPCSDYHLDTTAARFGDCRCGHSKQAHGKAPITPLKSAHQENTSEVTEMSPAKHEKSPNPCNEYHLDTTAARFGDCRCGHPKQAHGKPSPSTDVSSTPVGTSPSHQREDHPCSQYRVDVSAARFGDCKCGHPKNAHGSLSKPPTDGVEAVVPKVSGGVMEKQTVPCEMFRLDMAGQGFDFCKCGHPKSQHKGHKVLAAVTSEATQGTAKPPVHVQQATPCAAYQVDMTAKKFGTCVCGHPKADHGKASVKSAVVVATVSPNVAEQKQTKAARPCERFQPDMLAATFDICKCGHAKGAHGRLESNDSQEKAVDNNLEAKDTDLGEKDVTQNMPFQSTLAATQLEPTPDSAKLVKMTSPIVSTTLRKTASASSEQTPIGITPPEKELAANSPEPKDEAVVEPKPQLLQQALPETEAAALATSQNVHTPAPVPEQPPAFVPRRAAPPPPGPPAFIGAPQDSIPVLSHSPRRQAPLAPSQAPPVDETVFAAVPRRAAPLPPPGAHDQVLPAALVSSAAGFPRAPPPLPLVQPSAPVAPPGPRRPAPSAPPPVALDSGADVRKTGPPGVAQSSSSFPTVVPPRAAPTPPTQSFSAMPVPPPPMPYGQTPYGQTVPHVAAGSAPMPQYGYVQTAPMMPPPTTMRPPMQQQLSGSMVTPPMMQQQPMPYQMNQPPQHFSNKWSCPRCTFVNEAGALECLMCEFKPPFAAPPQQQQSVPMGMRPSTYPPPAMAPQPVPVATRPAPMAPAVPAMQQQGPSTAHWNCPRCTFLNPPTRMKCEICENPRPSMVTTQPNSTQPSYQQQPPSGGGGGATNPFNAFW